MYTSTTYYVFYIHNRVSRSYYYERETATCEHVTIYLHFQHSNIELLSKYNCCLYMKLHQSSSEADV